MVLVHEDQNIFTWINIQIFIVKLKVKLCFKKLRST